MANQEHLNILRQGMKAWKQWREEHPEIRPDLRDVNLRQAHLYQANLSQANLSGADLRGEANLRQAHLYQANLSQANLSGAHLDQANLGQANLSQTILIGAHLYQANLRQAILNGAHLDQAILIGADLRGADLRGADLNQAILVGADLREADLSWSNLSEAEFREANLTGCKIYAISAWNVSVEKTIQTGLVITRDNEATITVDNLEVAQFIYLLLNNQKIRDVIDTITSKVVLILGRFTPERKAVLDALRDELRRQMYLPVLFDFDKPASRDITETVSTLAHLARFVIADITDAKSIPQELMAIVPTLPSLAVQPLILASQHEYGMFEHFTRFPWVLPVYRYTDEVNLLQSLQEKVIMPVEQKAQELEKQ